MTRQSDHVVEIRVLMTEFKRSDSGVYWVAALIPENPEVRTLYVRKGGSSAFLLKGVCTVLRKNRRKFRSRDRAQNALAYVPDEILEQYHPRVVRVVPADKLFRVHTGESTSVDLPTCRSAGRFLRAAMLRTMLSVLSRRQIASKLDGPNGPRSIVELYSLFRNYPRYRSRLPPLWVQVVRT